VRKELSHVMLELYNVWMKLSNVKKKVNVDKIKKRIPMIILAAMLLLVTSSGVDILRAYKSPEQSIGRAINDGDYTEVMSIIESGSLALDSSEVVNLFIEKVTELSSGFESGVIDYWGAIEELKTIQNMNLESIAKDVENAVFYVENLNNSRMSYDQAESFYNAGNLLDALWVGLSQYSIPFLCMGRGDGLA